MWYPTGLLEVQFGTDEIVRIVTIRLKECITKRAVTNLCPLYQYSYSPGLKLVSQPSITFQTKYTRRDYTSYILFFRIYIDTSSKTHENIQFHLGYPRPAKRHMEWKMSYPTYRDETTLIHPLPIIKFWGLVSIPALLWSKQDNVWNFSFFIAL